MGEKWRAETRRTFSEAVAERHRAREQHGEGAEREQREPQGAREVDFERCGFAHFWGEERDDYCRAGDEGRGLGCFGVVSEVFVGFGRKRRTKPCGGAVAVEVVDLSRLVSFAALEWSLGCVHP